MKDYEVIIVGASFAGLAVARELSGHKVLLLDRKEVGVGQTSACGMPFLVPERLGLTSAILQRHDLIFLHFQKETLEFKPKFPFCTIGYQKFCRGLFQQSKVEFQKTEVLGLRGGGVATKEGIYRSRIFVDASGWRGALSRNPKLSMRDLSSGLETVLPYQEQGLHFWYLPKEFGKKTIFWLFPAGRVSRFGLGDYAGEGNLKPKLEKFLQKFKLKINAKDLHGGFFPHRLRSGVVGQIFLVGDSAGQCLPVTGEGIRPSFYFGAQCGRIIKGILEGKMSLESGLKAYRRLLGRKKFYYTFLLGLQNFFTTAPEIFLRKTVQVIQKQLVLDLVLRSYLRIAPL